MLGTISAFAYRHRETKKNLCRGGRTSVEIIWLSSESRHQYLLKSYNSRDDLWRSVRQSFCCISWSERRRGADETLLCKVMYWNVTLSETDKRKSHREHGRLSVWVFFVFSGSSLCDGLITHPEESYRLWCVFVCDLETSEMRRP